MDPETGSIGQFSNMDEITEACENCDCGQLCLLCLCGTCCLMCCDVK